MRKVDPSRLDLAREFRERPFGPHSEELQKVLKILRWDPFEDRIIAVQPRRSGPWQLARSTGRKGSPLEIFDGEGFATPAEAQWAIFRARWERHTGQPLYLDGDEPLPSTSSLKTDLTHRSVIGYADRFSVEAGHRIAFKVSAEGAYRVAFERLICGDDANIGLKTERLRTPVDGERPGRRQGVACGSYIEIEEGAPFALKSFTLLAYVWPTTPLLGRYQVVLGGRGYSLALDESGRLSLCLGEAGLSSGRALLERHWYLIAASFDAETGETWLAQRPLQRYATAGDTTAEAEAQLAVATQCASGFRIAAGFAADGAATAHYNGKIDSPAVLARPLSRDERSALLEEARVPALDEGLVAAWNFSREISTTRILDSSPRGVHGRTVNLPTRAMKGWNWDGSEYNWTHRPEHYGAIHFHDDDLYDCGWDTDFELEVPEDLASGLYCARLTREQDEEWIPFVVRPPRGTARAPLALIMPSASYWAYSNTHHHLEWREGENVRGVFTTIDATTLFLHEHPEFGCSLYDHHSDGSGVCYASRLRPILNMRPGERLWQLPADTHILDWLEAKGIAYDLLTEDDVECEGEALLRPYSCVMTGTHPEYPSKRMLDAFAAYQEKGGRFIYLGGNGFYWRTTYHPELPGVIEMRRAEDGIRTWAAEGGEYYHSFSGELGGMWRRMGRAPQSVAGTGMSAQGFDFSTYFERMPASFDPRAAFAFEGIGAEERIGDFGLIGGGAAGWEVDRADAGLGTPPHALVVATATDFTASYHWMKEELTHTHSANNGETCPLVRCDMVFYETPSGGAVFSTSSIAWAGALSHAGYDNNVSRITENVVRRFLDPTPFD
ncbi:N,N-dimethylformamidase beta subunit family domain-containing protein [Rhodospirillaceae bacterium SYSU D60014]|uniref:N,N-dimethylformamidase beta subunit family domain-containing protein n=1 Tax=Virgifigura deserti TaxID=2268457 RepID=UPI000E664A41